MKTFRCTASAAGLFGLCVASANASPVNLVQNGGFESTTVTHSTTLPANSNVTGSILSNWQNYSPGGTSYSVVYFPGEAATVGAAGCPTCLNPNTLWAATASPDGGNSLAFAGDWTANAIVSQLIPGLTVGHAYTLLFQYAAGQYNVGSGDTGAGWLVSFGTEWGTAPILSNASHGFTGWVESEMHFTATAANQVLSFMSMGGPTGLAPVALLDGVQLTDATSVPEPASVVLVGAGLLGLGVARRPKRAARTNSQLTA
jgi:hypothetical protein